ncbi:MAG: hypothetical protein U1A25_00405 [Candidatus Sungbacteria bacterium]|nr:hypothetical protein [bacterium]MDZ4260105.1 hypothetical protein [Candidatus Sungbacteria bacterium]
MEKIANKALSFVLDSMVLSLGKVVTDPVYVDFIKQESVMREKIGTFLSELAEILPREFYRITAQMRKKYENPNGNIKIGTPDFIRVILCTFRDIELGQKLCEDCRQGKYVRTSITSTIFKCNGCDREAVDMDAILH